jgi:hypothetical protein
MKENFGASCFWPWDSCSDQSTVNKVAVKLVNDSCMKVITDASANLTTTQVLSNSITIQNGFNISEFKNPSPELIIAIGEANKSAVLNCGLKINQRINATQKASQVGSFNNTSDLTTKIKTAVESQLKSSSEAKQALGSLSVANQTNINDVSSSINTRIDDTVKDSVFQALTAKIEAWNKATFINTGTMNCSPEGGIVIDQELVIKQCADLLTSAITGTTISEVEEVTEKSKADIENKVTQTGFAELVKSFFDGIANVFKGPFMIIGLVVIILAILAYVFRGTLSKIAEKKMGFSMKKMRFSMKKMGR